MHLKKSLGQHFLNDKGVTEKIIAVIRDLNCSRLLEVGPGGGALTARLMELPAIKFKAVEIDEEKAQYLKKKFPAIDLISQDFLKIPPPFALPFSVVGNFPYNISSQILFKILNWYPLVDNVIGMFQKEVAKRIVSAPGNKDYGVLSVLIQYYYDPTYLFDVGRTSFVPPPKVESGVIKLQKREQLLPVKNEEGFRKLVKTSFAQRRKTLRNNLKGTIGTDKLTDSLFDRRAETLCVEEFARLSFDLG